MTNDVVQKTMHQTNLRKRLNGDIGILHKHIYVKLNSLKHTSRYAQNQNIQGTKRFGGI